jgi:hypothetical protein
MAKGVAEGVGFEPENAIFYLRRLQINNDLSPTLPCSALAQASTFADSFTGSYPEAQIG